MNIIKKASLMATIVIVLSNTVAAPVMAAPADDAYKIAQFVASGLKGLGGMTARFNAIFLRDAIRGQMGELARLSPLEQAQFISEALDKVAVELGVSRGTIASVVARAFDLPAGSTFTIGGDSFSVIADGVVISDEDGMPVSAG